MTRLERYFIAHDAIMRKMAAVMAAAVASGDRERIAVTEVTNARDYQEWRAAWSNQK
jgi:hypothetical protein